ncbi:hypothetical protein CASFOL_035982 [Castilleja foliolosa]|uniref:F-box domain-containing protein n=1 Tax=Castilleja foliolosa TaxID=1961234 RepID=A0ABD3BWK0_9LAMI
MNKQSVKRRGDDDDDDDGGSATTIDDRLSQLPQPILHHILSLLPQKDAVRTCLLSKSWRNLWHSRFKVEFNDDWFATQKQFWSFLDNTLQRYQNQNLTLHQFIFDVRSVFDFALLQKWIPVVITKMCLRSLKLIISCGTTVFPLPFIVFQSEFLVELHLEGRNFNILESTENVMLNLNNLRTLRLHCVDITDEVFEKIISGCPLIENLNLLHCIGLESVKLHKHCNIKDFGCAVIGETIIEIEDPHALERFYIENCCWNWYLVHKNKHFPHLKSLELYRVQLPAETFSNFSSFFPCLKELTLDLCEGLEKFSLLSSSIKRLIIKMDMRSSIKAFIDTPNIRYFEYSGHHFQHFLPSIEFAKTSNEWNSQITAWYNLKRLDNDAMSWFVKLNKLLKGLSQSHITLTLIRNKYKKLDINDSYEGFWKPVVVEHLRLWECFLSSSDPDLLNCFLRICHPRYIHMNLYEEGGLECKKVNNLFEFMSKLIPDEIIGSDVWLKDLVGIEVQDKKSKDWQIVEGTICFRLTWREQL